jgi:hypothetical protein
MNLQNLTALKDVANSLIKQYGKDVEVLGQIIDPLVWAQESFLVAQNTTYPFILNTNKLNEAYNVLTYETSKKRITLAGYRLANYIMDIYKTSKSSFNLDERINNPKLLWKFFAEDSKIAKTTGTIMNRIKSFNIRS